MKIQHPAAIVVEIPEPIRSQIQSIRDSLSTVTAKLPVEITVTGSSGLGYIPPGSDLTNIKNEIGRIASEAIPFEVSFAKIKSFPNSFVFYLAPVDRKPFDSIHQSMRGSSIPFSNSSFPYTPHCTLRDGKALSQEESKSILSIPFPKESFIIDSISLFELSVYDPIEDVCDCHILYKKKFYS